MIRFGSLFAGIGGFDLGFERAGMKCVWQVEKNKQCRKLLRDKWPGAMLFLDVKTFLDECDFLDVDLICGGDPCPKHGNARRGQKSAHPDLSGYFLAVAGRLRPRWVVRENVPAPTVKHFATALETLGYGTITVGINAADFTLQNRLRTFVIGRLESTWQELREMFPIGVNVEESNQTRIGAREISPCLVTEWSTNNSDQAYVFENGRIRILDDPERARFAGFPPGWMDGFSHTACARGYGNSVNPIITEKIARVILRFDKQHGSQNPNSPRS